MAFIRDIRDDLRAAVERDPAARNVFEVLLCYPGVWAIIFHKLTHFLFVHKLKFIARWISQLIRWFTGVEIHPGATIGKRCFIDHGMAIVIGETTEIGDDVTIYQGVTLGGTGKHCGKRHPTIGNHVVISTGAKVLGPFKVGNDVKIGAGSVVLKEIPEGSTVVGIPGRIVKQKNRTVDELNQIDIPDPIANELKALRKSIRKLENEVGGLKEENRHLKEDRNEDI
ncbi:MAG TPA: serine O-acetyltransferase [Anaerovoracaceae bacterium]|nr:serine O-acetyltransferase [Anaerovoracaceae bacterium]